MANKNWKEIPNTNGCYLASRNGDIKSTIRQGSSGNILKPGKNRKGYYIVSISIDGKKITKQLHGLIAKTFIPNPENRPQVNHKNGIKTDNRVCNLQWVTNKQNKDHATKNGMVARGEEVPASKLVEKDIHNIRRIHKNKNLTYKDIAEKYNVTSSAIGSIIRKETWKHV